ncbi:uncharacterized protein LOC113279804 [Papaver somniferum]|uniref:uncharacterized protein LOC113279804 n=1 Tax=Papaver somniferum TaxID=3469 RepID=UPI000E702EB7|nr:uncharacterized protein LOC113279804 [Papaver somniferum]
MRHFGYSEKNIHWLHKIAMSTKILVLVNGGPCGFFKVGRGLRQGDTLYPILFVIAEEVLSRNITKMVQEVTIRSMVNRNGCKPSHLLFADDIFVFCNGHKKSLEQLMRFLLKYQQASWKMVNKSKSKCFVGGVIESRRREIAGFLQIELSDFPDKYLGVIFKPGKVKNNKVWGIVEMLQKLLARWMGKILAFSERLTLVKSVLCSIPIYNMSVYRWPSEVIKECERTWVINDFEEATRWIVDDGQTISVWKDKWVKTQALCDIHPQDEFILQHKDMKMSELITNCEWKIPVEMNAYFNENELPCIENGADRRIWETSLTWEFSVANAVQDIRKKSPK